MQLTCGVSPRLLADHRSRIGPICFLTGWLLNQGLVSSDVGSFLVFFVLFLIVDMFDFISTSQVIG